MGKKEILDLIQRFPDNMTEAEVLEELHFRLQVERGLKDAAEGRVITHDEFKSRIAGRRNSAGP